MTLFLVLIWKNETNALSGINNSEINHKTEKKVYRFMQTGEEKHSL